MCMLNCIDACCIAQFCVEKLYNLAQTISSIDTYTESAR